MASKGGDRVVLSGSEKAPLRGARSARKLDPEERFEVTVRVRPRPRTWIASRSLLTSTASTW